jgi:hypothetical protein
MIRWVGQVAAYGVFVAGIGLLSAWPQYRVLGESEAMVSLTLTHAGQRLGECRRLTQEELNELPPNMRKPDVCPRERHPLRVDLLINDRLAYAVEAQPSGLWSDGKGSVYRRVAVNAGEHEIFVGMNDSGTDAAYDFELRRRVVIRPGQNLVISFDDLSASFEIE